MPIRILLLIALCTLVLSNGCYHSRMYFNEKSCSVDSSGKYHVCYYMVDGKMMSTKVPLDSSKQEVTNE